MWYRGAIAAALVFLLIFCGCGGPRETGTASGEDISGEAPYSTEAPGDATESHSAETEPESGPSAEPSHSEAPTETAPTAHSEAPTETAPAETEPQETEPETPPTAPEETEPVTEPEPAAAENTRVLAVRDRTGWFFDEAVPSAKVVSVSFLSRTAGAPEDARDVSEPQDGSVLFWVEEEEDGSFRVYIGADGGVLANADSSRLFANLVRLEQLDLRGLSMSSVEDFSWMFSECRALTILDLSGRITGRASRMTG
ncbi:MAG: hypothetical protein J6U26_01075, partial [Lachnospiraceae bacterium]|nr:hypothetical protein [Lachnospiraceae bacterium]